MHLLKRSHLVAECDVERGASLKLDLPLIVEPARGTLHLRKERRLPLNELRLASSSRLGQPSGLGCRRLVLVERLYLVLERAHPLADVLLLGCEALFQGS